MDNSDRILDLSGATHFLVAARCAHLACAALDRERAAA
jgi:hypothetical protein